ncbi:cobalamin B12-binding domain-containing protein [Roseibacterium sp. SDUM158017]|uniref:cobalamin B12-binding domain-containing protein n=1 Tax=Roseicyclus salinarum TaxID=3036773 RepID=UPI002414EA0C|nr:cobalamin B12-binding domain-containing protein [Roseibacterium sp. SDUM158017]MDG4649139.1 cobalamin B12-binding domain-containing protein [Roseibacterium sp. SDUM158017]
MARSEDGGPRGGGGRSGANPDAVEGLARIALGRLADRDVKADLSPAFLDSFCALLADGDYRAAERILRTMKRRRPGYTGVADGILTAAARHLGEKWEADETSFGEMSVAVAQIFRLNQTFGQRNAPWKRRPGRRLALFATLPGQAHNLGIVLAAEAFRQEDWDVTLLLDTPGRQVEERVRRMRPETVGLSMSFHDRPHHVEYLIRELRSLPYEFRLLLGGVAAQDLQRSLPAELAVTVVTDIATALREV